MGRIGWNGAYTTYTTYMTYQDLKSYQQAVIIHDFTVEFCKRYIDKFSRTRDQMEQAARSGKQNIVEGCSVSKTSPPTELKLIGVARGSLKELLEDYQDFLRQRKLEIWEMNDPRTLAIRKLAYRSDKLDRTDRSYKSDRSDRAEGEDVTGRSDRTYKSDKSDRSDRSGGSDGFGGLDKLDRTDGRYTTYTTYQTYMTYLNDSEKAANAMIVLINQTNYLLDQQIKAVEGQLGEKGISTTSHQEKLRRFLEERKRKNDAFDQWLKNFRNKS